MAEQLLDKHHDKIGELTLTPSSGGRFEVTYGDELIYSKLETGKFPEPADIIAIVDAK